jgi:hypothetical protein
MTNVTHQYKWNSLLRSHSNNGYVNAQQCYAIRLLPIVLFYQYNAYETHISLFLWTLGKWKGKLFFRTGRVGWKGPESFYVVLTEFIALKIPADSFLLQNVQTHPKGTRNSFLGS